MKTIFITQSNYIPWKGYFDAINQVDEFILYDDVQYTKNDWRNRNKVKTAQGLKWLTIPVLHSLSQNIKEIKISDSKWNNTHWKTLITNYSKSPYFKETRLIFEELYLSQNENYLSKINLAFIKVVNNYLGIKTKISSSSDFVLRGDKNERLVYLCKQANASTYLSAPAGKNYINEALFGQENIQIEWLNYNDYPEYPQLFPPFAHDVSILDLIFNTGPACRKYLKSTKQL